MGDATAQNRPLPFNLTCKSCDLEWELLFRPRLTAYSRRCLSLRAPSASKRSQKASRSHSIQKRARE
jgi:hypothetical protein